MEIISLLKVFLGHEKTKTTSVLVFGFFPNVADVSPTYNKLPKSQIRCYTFLPSYKLIEESPVDLQPGGNFEKKNTAKNN